MFPFTFDNGVADLFSIELSKLLVCNCMHVCMIPTSISWMYVYLLISSTEATRDKHHIKTNNLENTSQSKLFFYNP